MLKRLLVRFGEADLLLQVLALVKPVKGIFMITTGLAVLLAVLAPLQPHFVQIAVDDYIFTNDLVGLQNVVLILLALLAANSISRYAFIYLSTFLGQSIIKDLRDRVFKHISNLRLRYFDTTPIGAVTTRTINDVEAVNDIFAAGIINIIADVLTILVIIGFMFSKDWRLSILCLCAFPFFIYATYQFKEGIKVSYKAVRKQIALLNTFVQEHISGMSLIQTFAVHKPEQAKFESINAKHRDAHMESIWYYSIFFPAIEIIQATTLGLLVWWGANLVMNQVCTLGVLIAFIMYLGMLFRPLRTLADKFNTLQMGLVAAERVFSVLQTNDIIPNNGTQSADSVRGDISFEQVSFAYNEKDLVLKNVSFDIEAGQTLAIVGPTGAGKSSIINILNRFYEIQSGSIKIDGVDVRNYSLPSLRNNIGVVLQDVFLFSGSVMDNITLRNPSISKEDVKRAVKMVGADTFIKQLPGGFDYEVMERGATLAMGQRQLISFIRTLVYDPRILVLDEATSSVDTETEELVQSAIKQLIVNRTSIVIAHRLSTIREADKIVVLNKGELVEIGSHEELMELGGHYRNLHDKQFQLSLS